jgi:hypothetical protein
MMKQTTHAFLKESLRSFFLEFLQAFLPDIASKIATDSAGYLKNEINSDLIAGGRAEPDFIVQAVCNGEESYFLVFIENHINNATHTPKRVFNYFARFQTRHESPVYPIIIRLQEESCPPDSDSDAIDRDTYAIEQVTDLGVCLFRYFVVQVNQLKWRDYTVSTIRPNPIVAMLMLLMPITDEERAEVRAECFRHLATAQMSLFARADVAGFIRGYLPLTPDETMVFHHLIAKIPDKKTRGTVLELIEDPQEKREREMIDDCERRASIRLASLWLGRRFGSPAQALTPSIAMLKLKEARGFLYVVHDFTALEQAVEWLENPMSAED